MRTAMRPRYYCDHCKRGSGSPSFMRRHEAGCTANPNRICGMCRLRDGGAGYMDAGLAAFASTEEPRAQMQALREAVEDCPACIFAVLRQSGAMGAQYVDPNDEKYWLGRNESDRCPVFMGFDFKFEMAEAWSTR